jgi:hypothetical protein
LGGYHKGFNVYQQSDRLFRFLVASNKVGHMIYGLKYRVWPDFVCHFSLFRWFSPSVTGFIHDDGPLWSSKDELLEVSSRSPMRFKPNLTFLMPKTNFPSESFVQELSKFGLFDLSDKYPANTPQDQANDTHDLPIESIVFGGHSPSTIHRQNVAGRKFIGSGFKHDYFAHISDDVLPKILDLHQAGYLDPKIVAAVGLFLIPPLDLVYSHLNFFSDCSLTGHVAQNCPGICCLDCHYQGRCCWACSNGPRKMWVVATCKKCQARGHTTKNCHDDSVYSQDSSVSVIKEKIVFPLKNRQVWQVKGHMRQEKSLVIRNPLDSSGPYW